MKEINLCWNKKCLGCPKAFIDYDGTIKIIDDYGGKVKLTIGEFDKLYEEIRR